MKIFNQPVRIAGAALLFLLATAASATTVVPTTDASLFERSDVVVHGRVLFSYVEEAIDGTPIVDLKPVLHPDVARR